MNICLFLVCDVHDTVVFHFDQRVTNMANRWGHRGISIGGDEPTNIKETNAFLPGSLSYPVC